MLATMRYTNWRPLPFLPLLCVAGTNDKAGSPFYIHKFVNLQAVKTQFDALPHWSYEKRKWLERQASIV